MGIETIYPNTEHAVVFDSETGLVIHHTIKDKRKKAKLDKYIGIETKWPDDCITKDSLIDCLSLLDAYLKNDPLINNQALLDSIFEEHLTEQQAKLVNYICKNIAAWNYYIGSIKDLYSSVGISPKHIAAVLNKLEPNVVRVLHRNKPFKGDIILLVNPYYGWKGDYALLKYAKNKWYSHNYKKLPSGCDLP